MVTRTTSRQSSWMNTIDRLSLTMDQQSEYEFVLLQKAFLPAANQ